MGNRIELYANDRKKDFEELKQEAMEKLAFNDLGVTELEVILNKVFKMGRYVGHCQGEVYMRKAYHLDGDAS